MTDNPKDEQINDGSTAEQEGFYIPKEDDKVVLADADNTVIKIKGNKDHRALKIGLVIIGTLAVLAVIASVSFLLSRPPRVDESTMVPTGPSQSNDFSHSAKASLSADPSKIEVGDTPLAAAMNNPTVPPSSKEIVSVKNSDSIQTESKTAVTISGAVLTEPNTKCEVIDSSNFCLAGYGDFKGDKIEVYYFKDIANSLFFYNPHSFSKVDSELDKTIGISDIDFAGEKRKVVVVGNQDASGVMISSPGNQSEEFANSIVSSLK